MADIKLNELGTTTDFAQAYVEDSTGAQKRISKANLLAAANAVIPNTDTNVDNFEFVIGVNKSGNKVKVNAESLISGSHMTDAIKTFINPSTASATLVQRGNHDVMADYVDKCKCYVFNSAGTKKAEILAATFEGGTDGGTITFDDGTTKTIKQLNDAGCNFMVYRPEMGILGTTENGADVLYNAGVGSINGGYNFPSKYIGMFKAYNMGGVLKSQPNQVPTCNLTIKTFQDYAKAGGQGWGLWNYTDWCKENALHLSFFGNTNYQDTIGVGRINNYDNVRNIVTGYTLPLLNGHGAVATVDSANNSVNCLNHFGAEGLGEQIWEFVIGFRHDGAGKATIWNDNAWREDHAGRELTLPVTSANGEWIKTVIGGKYMDMMLEAKGGSASNGYCDGHWISSGGRVLFVGGAAANGSVCGLSASCTSDGFGVAYVSLGTRLAFYGESETVTGATLLS